MQNFLELISSVLFLLASIFLFLSAFGVWRMPTLFLQAHCSSLASTLGILLSTFSIFILSWDLESRIKILIIPLLVFLCSPVSTHLLTRAVRRMEEDSAGDD